VPQQVTDEKGVSACLASISPNRMAQVVQANIGYTRDSSNPAPSVLKRVL